jgi:hypothetical protein
MPASINDNISARQITLPRCNSCHAVAICTGGGVSRLALSCRRSSCHGFGSQGAPIPSVPQRNHSRLKRAAGSRASCRKRAAFAPCIARRPIAMQRTGREESC